MATFDDYVDGTTALAEAIAESQVAQNRRIGAVEESVTSLEDGTASDPGDLAALLLLAAL